MVGRQNQEAVTCFCHAYTLLLSPIPPHKPAPLCLFHVFSSDLPLINSMHLDDTSSAVILPPVLNMTFSREVDFLHEDLRMLSKTYLGNVRGVLKKK